MIFFSSSIAQENPPAPSAPRSVNIPGVNEKSLPNGLKVVVVERENVPLVTVSLLVKSGANAEDNSLAGLADMTVSLLLKGTKTRTATQIAEEMDFLGGNINSSASWNASNVTVNSTSDKLEPALAIMSDVVLNPTFALKEIELYKTQTLDELNVQLKQPSALANFVASRYSFGEHSTFGTPETISKINQTNISDFYREAFAPNNSILIFTGDITYAKANALAQKYFGKWSNQSKGKLKTFNFTPTKENSIVRRILVVDLPNSGQAAVTYAKKLGNIGRTREDYFFPASVVNSVLGGGYSARLNQEIRIKQGLSYGASSGFTWRPMNSNFLARAQTKNASAAKVAELMTAEIAKITTNSVSQDELKPRKAVLTGNFGHSLETTGGLAAQISELYLYGLKPNELNSYMQKVESVSNEQVKNFASENITGGDIIIVGDAKIFMDDLKKRFPDKKIEVISASDLDLNRDDLRKTQKTVSKF
jgi:zinc protease